MKDFNSWLLSENAGRGLNDFIAKSIEELVLVDVHVEPDQVNMAVAGALMRLSKYASRPIIELYVDITPDGRATEVEGRLKGNFGENSEELRRLFSDAGVEPKPGMYVFYITGVGYAGPDYSNQIDARKNAIIGFIPKAIDSDY